MPDIHIVRRHGLGLERARKLAFRWAEVAETKMHMDCTYEQGRSHDVLSFGRPGARGELQVDAEQFELKAHLGLLLGVFKGRIETEIVNNLDLLLEHEDPLHAFEQGLARHEARHDERQGRHEPRHAKPHADPHKAPAARKGAGK